MTRRRQIMADYINHEVRDGGRVYRVCLNRIGRPYVVALKGKQRERFLNLDGRRARQLIAIVKAGRA